MTLPISYLSNASNGDYCDNYGIDLYNTLIFPKIFTCNISNAQNMSLCGHSMTANKDVG